jgi:hypothetical protein
MVGGLKAFTRGGVGLAVCFTTCATTALAQSPDAGLVRSITFATLRQLEWEVYESTKTHTPIAWRINVADTAVTAWRDLRDALKRILHARPVTPADSVWQQLELAPVTTAADTASTSIVVSRHWRCGTRIHSSSRHVLLRTVREGGLWRETQAVQTVIGDPPPCAVRRNPLTASNSVNSPTGTWEIRVCKATRVCSDQEPLSILVRGVLVISDDTLGFGDLPAKAHPWFSAFSGFRPRRTCYVLERLGHPGISTTQAGMARVQWSGWARGASADSLLFELYRSPDMDHGVRARIHHDSLTGIGRSRISPVFGELTSWGADRVAGKRIGPPDPGPCIAAAKNESWPGKGRPQ